MKFLTKIGKIIEVLESIIYRGAKVVFALWVIYQALFGEYSMAQVLEWFK